jgi:hypothetical protein
VVHKPCWNESGIVSFVKKKNNGGKLTRYDHAFLAIFESRGFYVSIAHVGKKKWPVGGIFELSTWFIIPPMCTSNSNTGR